MRLHPFLAALILAVGALVAVAAVAAAPLLLPARATVTLELSTEPIPRLLPHAHTGADKVGDPSHGIIARSAVVAVPETMWVGEAKVRLRNAPREVIHHLQLIRISGGEERPVLTVGQDSLETFRFPEPTGILLAEGEGLMIEAVLHNPVPPLGEGGIYDDVAATIELSGVRDGEGRHVPVNFVLVKVTDSVVDTDNDSTFSVPARAESFVRRSEQNPASASAHLHLFPNDGWIVHMGAHLHAWEGGERLDAYVNGKPAWSFRSRHTDPEAPWRVETDAGPSLIPFSKGDFVTVSATYSNPDDEPRMGAMGMLGIYYIAGTPSDGGWMEARFRVARRAYGVLDALGLL